MTCLHEYPSIALTPTVMKCFERIVMTHMKRTNPATLDPLQSTYHLNRFIDDAVSVAIYTALTHIEGKDRRRWWQRRQRRGRRGQRQRRLLTNFIFNHFPRYLNTYFKVTHFTGGERRYSTHRWKRVETFKFLGTYISEDLTWSHNAYQEIPAETVFVKKAEENIAYEP